MHCGSCLSRLRGRTALPRHGTSSCGHCRCGGPVPRGGVGNAYRKKVFYTEDMSHFTEKPDELNTMLLDVAGLCALQLTS